MNTILHLSRLSTRAAATVNKTTRCTIAPPVPRATLPSLYHQIPPTRAEAASMASLIPPTELQIFTDGSAFRGGVGGAARARLPGMGTLVLKEYLGAQPAHLAVEGEILGVILGLQILKTARTPKSKHATILVDCQQAIRELVNGRSKHVELLERFHCELKGLGKKLQSIRFMWVPGHKGALMNELVDQDAKAVAEGEHSIKLYF
ncbi:hypothetical protein FB45DRAFT_875706 [Roridomyces roridus]|uniref:RNase H type-1 domain-containing protein n=1 Tax=Roridomyces roridus TaxID=1738132 RepID=A0AAD7B584_9AGAR|nr:hypothetical protein FB45DRAFT_875706 [Roridomyces roridus]